VTDAEPWIADPARRWRIRDDQVAWRKVVEDMVLLDLDTSAYHGLNSTGALVWQGIADGLTEGELASLVASQHPAAAARVPDDVGAFLEALSRIGLIEQGSAGQ
jgi:hypothetical protein